MGQVLTCFALAFAITAVAPLAAATEAQLPDEQLWRVTHNLTGGRVETPVLIGRPGRARAQAVIILLPGGDGRLKLHVGARPGRLKNNFLLRTRHQLRRAGYATALIDVPSDRRRMPGLLNGYRASKTHAVRDIGQVAAHLRMTFRAPIFVVGISRGAVSAANAARRLGSKLAGVALLASLTQPNRKGANINAVQLDQIAIPTLFIHHAFDHCHVTPLRGARASYELMRRAGAAVRWAVVTGGQNSSGQNGTRDCKGKSHHGFWRAEPQVIGYLTSWLDAVLNKPPLPKK